MEQDALIGFADLKQGANFSGPLVSRAVMHALIKFTGAYYGLTEGPDAISKQTLRALRYTKV